MSEPIDNNPKTRFGMTKPNPFVVPPASILYQSLAMMEGARKYGPYNWRENKVTASIYVAAAMRHLMQWMDGQDNDDNPGGSGKPHIGHALACLGIIADATETGNLIDDRPVAGKASDIIAKWTTQVAPDLIEEKRKAVAEKAKFNTVVDEQLRGTVLTPRKRSRR